MMKQFYTLVLMLSMNCISARSQPILFPFSASPVTLDGTLSPGEWTGAGSSAIYVNSTDSVTIRYKHDGTAMYFAFTGKLESAGTLFPEIVFDPQLQSSSSWVGGQWWFHVSATDCENNGAYGVYTNCLPVQREWNGAPNFTAGPPLTDTVEIRIPFSKISYDPASASQLGVAFVVTNTMSLWRLWPSGADKDIPSTWGRALFAALPPPYLLSYFTATRVNSTSALLKWQTTSEFHLHHFVIEHSTDSIVFNDIAQLNASIISSTPKNYNYTHSGMLSGKHFYRLRMVEENGSFTRSSITKVELVRDGVFNVFPNPAREVLTIEATGMTSNSTYSIVSATGQLIKKDRVGDAHINLEGLPSGNYKIQLQLAGGPTGWLNFIKSTR
jgi:hypothetical protein